jgi:Phytanoyl-CoA dioxygenase (PhyH)
MTPPRVFHDPALQERYDRLGYAVLPALTLDLVQELRDAYRRLSLEDLYGIGYTVSLYSSEVATRRKAQEILVSRAFPALEPFLVSRTPYMGTYLVKEAHGRLIPPHQDWTHCDETKHDSLMCWVPLVDVDERNGGLGFIDGSHRYFDYLRAFPYEVAETPVRRHGAGLVAYLNILRLRAGEAVVFNNRTIHGSLGNDTAEPRMAFSFALHPAGEPLLGCYLKPNGRADTLLKYRVGPEFYVEYPHPRTLELYRRGAVIPGYACEEVPYRLPSLAWEALEDLLVASGNRKDPGKAARVEPPERRRA